MVRIELVRDKIRRLRSTLDLLRACLPENARILSERRDALDLVSFRVYLVMQEAVDLASHVIADEGWGPVPSLREHFAVLATRGILDAALASALASGVKVRNLIAHGYAEVDPARLHEAAAVLLPIGERFCAAMLAFAEKDVVRG